MKVELIHITPEAEKIIEEAGRTAWLTFDKKNEDSAEKFIRMLISRKHYSVLEHATATFRISEVSRTMTHQLVRHRLAAYTQQSQRVVKESDLKKYTIPPSIVNKCEEDGDLLPLQKFHTAMEHCFNAYDFLIDRGIKREDARFVLPNACQTQIVMTGNFRTWRHVIKMRGSKHAQWEIRAVAKEILRILWEECPSAFEDLKVYEV